MKIVTNSLMSLLHAFEAKEWDFIKRYRQFSILRIYAHIPLKMCNRQVKVRKITNYEDFSVNYSEPDP